MIDSLNGIAKPVAENNSPISGYKDTRLLSILQTNPEEIARAEEKMREILNEIKRRKGYSEDSSYQGTSAFNGAAPSANAYFPTRKERIEAYRAGEFDGDGSLGDFMEAGIDNGNLDWSIHDPIGYHTASTAGKESILNLRRTVDGKKWGMKVGEVTMPELAEGSRTMHSVDVTPEMKESVMQGQVLFRFAEEREDFDAMRDRAIANKGLVMPGLAEKEVNVVSVPKHDFEGTGKEALQQAEIWAKENIVGTHKATDSDGKEFEYSIGNKAVEKYVSKSSTVNSENVGIHLSVLKKLPDVIANSIETEVHPDYEKGSGGRSSKSDINEQSLIHRFYGAVDIDGVLYKVKTTIREYADESRTSKAHNYEVTKIKLLEAPSGNNDVTTEPVAMTSNNSISGANLLQGVEKSYDKGKNLLDESEKTAMFRESEDAMLDRLSDEIGNFAALARKTMKGGYSKAQRERYARAEWRRAHRVANGMVEKMNLGDKVHLVDDVNDLPESRNWSARKRNSKGWYDTKTGDIYIIMKNHSGSKDVAQSILHESVAHHGLRICHLFEKLYPFLDSFRPLLVRIRERLVAIAYRLFPRLEGLCLARLVVLPYPITSKSHMCLRF